MLMPGRQYNQPVNDIRTFGSTQVNGHTLPTDLVLYDRHGSASTTKYVASRSITLLEGFDSENDELEGTIGETDYDGSGNQSITLNSADGGYRYGFNGKENDNEIKGVGNQQDYGMRIYDPRLGRFLSVDPIYKDFPWYSPYHFAGNTPIWAIDLDGLEPMPLFGVQEVVSNIETFAKPSIELGPTLGTLARPALSSWRVQGGNLIQKTSLNNAEWNISVVPYWNEPRLRAPDISTTSTQQSPQKDPQPKENPQRQFDPKQQPAVEKEADQDIEKPFYVTYTRVVVNSDGSTNIYSGRAEGTYKGSEPTKADALRAVKDRYKAEPSKGNAAVVDRFSTNYLAIRGREQQLIDLHGGAQKVDKGYSANTYRAVSRSNPLRHLYDYFSTLIFKGKLKNNNPADKPTR